MKNYFVLILLCISICLMGALIPAHEEQASDQDQRGEDEEIYGDVVVNENWGETRFMREIIHGVRKKWPEDKFLSVLQEYIREGVTIDKTDYQGRTALMHACKVGAPCAVIQKLIDAGACVNQRSRRQKNTALMYCCMEHPSYEIVKMLLDAGALVTKENRGGNTVLDLIWNDGSIDHRIKKLLYEHYILEIQEESERQDLIRRLRALRAAQEGHGQEVLEEKEFQPEDRAPVFRQINREE